LLQLGDHFRSVDGRQRSDWERLQRQFARNRSEQEHKERLEDRQEEQILAFATEAIAATEAQLKQFAAKLDSYEEATVVALMENQERLDAVQARIALMLDEAYVLEDGRRVFKTEDGTQVFDEFGVEVSADEVDFDLIGPDRPTWEAYSAGRAEELALTTEREQLLDFQERLDEAREEIAAGEISEAELNELDAELAELMPASVRMHVPGMEVQEEAPELAASFSRSAVIPQVQGTGLSGASPTQPMPGG